MKFCSTSAIPSWGGTAMATWLLVADTDLVMVFRDLSSHDISLCIHDDNKVVLICFCSNPTLVKAMCWAAFYMAQ